MTFSDSLPHRSDVISTRRLSYILYLPDPSQPWEPRFGGALELYPVVSPHIPEAIPTKTIPPAWNQYTFFTVQPGHSFHSVEEVAHPTASRLSISGWFHRPQEGEEGYDVKEEEEQERLRKEHSSVESLASKQAARPFLPYPSDQVVDDAQGDDEGKEVVMMSTSAFVPGSPLSSEEKTFLSYFLNPAYLQPKVQAQLFEQFGDESHILLADFLKKDFKEVLEKGLQQLDKRDGFRWWEPPSSSKQENGTKSGSALREEMTIQKHESGIGKIEKAADSQVAPGAEWTIQGPPHRHRYLSLTSPADKAALLASDPSVPISTPPSTAEEALELLRSYLFPSPAFRHFLANITQLLPLAARAPFQARRFRPGLDYSLARADDDEAVLHVNLGLTPDVAQALENAAGGGSSNGAAAQKLRGMAAKRGKALPAKSAPKGMNGSASSSSACPLTKKQIKDLKTKWESGDIGGWECFMAPHEGEEDPAVYASAESRKQQKQKEANGSTSEGKTDAAEEEEGSEDEEMVEAEFVDGDEEMDDDDSDFDGVLLNLTPQSNALNVALRDEGVLHFVKYLSASAGSSRWDVEGEWTVGALDEAEEEAGKQEEA